MLYEYLVIRSLAQSARTHEKGSPGKLLEVNRVLYNVKGWNQLPLSLLRKHWAQGPRRSRRLSERARCLLHTRCLRADGGSDSDGQSDEDAPQDICAHAGVRAYVCAPPGLT